MTGLIQDQLTRSSAKRHQGSRILTRSFYERGTRVVAIELLGKVLMFEQNGHTLAAKIVETEAYFGSNDPASHAYRGVTPRNRVMFGQGGMSYVYFTYGNHYCFNVVTETEGTAGAVLIRSAEPMAGIAVMRRNRPKVGLEQLTNGPAKLTQAFGITTEHSELDLTKGPLWVAEEDPDEVIYRIKATKRIGISRAKDKLYRFYLEDNPFVSKR